MWSIVVFNLQTIGRYSDIEIRNLSPEERISELVRNLGGADNFIEVGNCVTRLRLTLKDSSKINSDELKKLGVFGVVSKGKGVQVIVGTGAEHIANDIKKFVGK